MGQSSACQIFARALQVLCIAATAVPALCMLQALILSARRSTCRHCKNCRAVTTRALAEWAGPASPVPHKQQADRAGRSCWSTTGDTITGSQGFAASAFEAEEAPTRADENEPSEHGGEVDFRYRIPLEDVWPASKSQRKIASRVHRGLEAAVQRLSASGDHIIQSLGFCVEQVRMSPDNMKAFILWSGLPESEDRLEQSLQSKAGALRMMLANVMRIRRVPRLEFRRNELTEEQQALEQEFERLKQDE